MISFLKGVVFMPITRGHSEALKNNKQLSQKKAMKNQKARGTVKKVGHTPRNPPVAKTQN